MKKKKKLKDKKI